MTEPRVCADCGAKLTGLTCENCGAYVGLAVHGFVVKKAPSQGYILLDHKEKPILTFSSLGSKTASNLAKRTKAPIEILERELANLASIPPDVDMMNGEKKSQADRMIEYALASELKVFTDERGEAYAYFLRDDVFVIYRMRSRTFRTWLAGLLWENENKAPGNEATYSAINVLTAIADKGDRIHLHNRVAPDGAGGFWFDMTNDRRQAIHITKGGWKIIDAPPILFRRYSHQKPVKPPIRGGSILPLLDFMNVKHLGSQLLYIVSGISALIPNIPHVVIILFGPQGSGKSWMILVLRELIDPSILKLLSLPRNQREMAQQFFHNYFPVYDNITKIPSWQSDVLCRAVTGGGFSKRKLYTDEEDVLFSFRRPLSLNGISVPSTRADLLDRSVLIGHPKLDETTRKSEKELEAILKQKAPELLGAILDILVKALNIYDSIKITPNRMADYTIWGCAITAAMGIDQKHFLSSYKENIATQKEIAVMSNPVAGVLASFMDSQKDKFWEGTPAALYSNLLDTAKELKISTRQKIWPKNPSALSRRLNDLSPNLPAVGYEIESDHTGAGGRKIMINAVNVVNVVISNDDWGKGKDLRAYIDLGSNGINAINGISPILSSGDLDKHRGEKEIGETPVNEEKTPKKEEAPPFEAPRPSLKEEETIVESLINAIRIACPVGELWPRVYLEGRGVRREDAINIVEGLRQAGEIIQDEGGKTWTVKELGDISTEPNPDEEEPTEEEKKNLQEELDKVWTLVFDWKDGLHTDKVASELGIDRHETLKLLNLLKRDGRIISNPEGKEGWWKT